MSKIDYFISYQNSLHEDKLQLFDYFYLQLMFLKKVHESKRETFCITIKLKVTYDTNLSLKNKVLTGYISLSNLLKSFCQNKNLTSLH